MSSYRPNYHDPPPPPPPDLPPLPPGPPPSYGSRENFWNAPRGSQYPLPRSDFSFRIAGNGPQYPRDEDAYRPTQNIKHSTNGNFRQSERGPRRGERSFRGRGPKVIPSARPLLQRRDGEDGNEQSLGVDLDTQKFLPIDDISENDEDGHNEVVSNSEGENRYTKDYDSQAPPAKRRELASNGDLDGENVPKWSNPDPYSVLPPVEDANRKRKDPVAFIRKGFKPADEKIVTQNQVTANDDFISFEDDARETTPSSRISQPESTASLGFTVLDIGDQSEVIDLTVENESLLGSRKRTYEDEIKPERREQKVSATQISGSLLEAWIPCVASEATPWVNKETSSIISPGFRLHREICDFFEFVRPQQHEHHIRQDLLSRLQILIARELPDCTVQCFGSFAAGLYLPNADMDVVINSNVFNATGEKVICQSKSKLHKFGQFIRGSRMAQENSVEVIASAKVPIIKFIDRLTALKVDVSFENATGIVANNTFSVWKQQYPAVSVLVAVIKQFLMMRGLNEVQFGGLGGFSVTCLVVSLLQNMPRVQNKSLVAEENLGEILIEFLDFYGNRIDISRTGIMMNPPGYFDKQAWERFKGRVYNPNQIDKIAILDPNRPDNDISGGSKKVTLIFDRFARAHEELQRAMKMQNRPCLLDWLLGGNYESFVWHRARLLNVYNDDGESSHLNSPDSRSPNNQLLIDIQAPCLVIRDSATQALSDTVETTARRRDSGGHSISLLKAPYDTREHTQMSPTEDQKPEGAANVIMHPDRARLLNLGVSCELTGTENASKMSSDKLATVTNDLYRNGFERWTSKCRLRTVEKPSSTFPIPSLSFGSPHQPHLLVGQPTVFTETAPPSKPGNYGIIERFARSVPEQMAPPSDERRAEVSQHFSGCSPHYPIKVD